MSSYNRVQDLIEKREVARQGGGAERINKQHAQGRYTAR